jgi:hypothetical protein
MADLLSQLQEWRDSNDVGNTLESNIVLFVVCAGENDVSSGQSIDKIQKTFSSFLEKLFCPNLNSGQINTQSSNERLLFLGPKFEPWQARYTELYESILGRIVKILFMLIALQCFARLNPKMFPALYMVEELCQTLHFLIRMGFI